tara:strand:- start:3258 stop:3650 length:393 start_codon:yes stop_codon:yes gene_type:complete
MAIEDDFYCTIKLKCGDEIFCKVAANEDEDRIFLLLSNPITIEEIVIRGTVTGYKVEPWLKTSDDDLIMINIDDVLTMTENCNVDMITYYHDYLRKNNKENNSKLSREMGYISSVKEAKKTLEKLYRETL